MSKFYRMPSRVDVIFLPRDWELKAYSKGLMLSFTGSYSISGGVSRGWFRIGPAETEAISG